MRWRVSVSANLGYGEAVGELGGARGALLVVLGRDEDRAEELGRGDLRGWEYHTCALSA